MIPIFMARDLDNGLESIKLMLLMDHINSNDLRRVDLNLLVVFSVLMAERSVQRAARRLFLTPSATSMALGRLRDLTGDPLFIRRGNVMVPTEPATRLYERLAPALDEVRGALLGSAPFDPATVQAVVKLAAPDNLEVSAIPALLGSFRNLAPGLRLALRHGDQVLAPLLLHSGEIELAIVVRPPDLPPTLACELLRRETFEVVFDRRVLKVSRLGLGRYVEQQHVLVSAEGAMEGIIDRSLAALGRSRTVVAALPRFSTLPFAIRGSPRIATVPSLVARHCEREMGLARCALPFPSPTFDAVMLWHVRSEADALQAWVRAEIRALFRGVARRRARVVEQ
jgi:LysR family transcriptional regulator, mexEF-oprN operon transcriptional activator